MFNWTAPPPGICSELFTWGPALPPCPVCLTRGRLASYWKVFFFLCINVYQYSKFYVQQYKGKNVNALLYLDHHLFDNWRMVAPLLVLQDRKRKWSRTLPANLCSTPRESCPGFLLSELLLKMKWREAKYILWTFRKLCLQFLVSLILVGTGGSTGLLPVWDVGASTCSLPVWGVGGSTGLLPVWGAGGSTGLLPVWGVGGSTGLLPVWGVGGSTGLLPVWGAGGSTGLLPVWGVGGSTGLLPVWGVGGSTGLFCLDDPNPVPLLKSDMESFGPYRADVVRTAAALRGTLPLLPRWLCCDVIILCVLGCVMTCDDCNNSWLLCGLWLPLLLLLQINKENIFH